MSDVSQTIRNVIERHGRLPVPMSTLTDDDDLYECGLSSHASVNVMLALEDEFEIEIPDSLLRKDTFESVSAIRAALATLGVPNDAERTP